MSETNDHLLSKTIAEICRMNARRSNIAGAIRSSSPMGVKLVGALQSIAKLIPHIVTNFSSAYEVSYSRGMGNLPAVLWVAITERGRAVSTSVSATICFGIRGEGVVVGLMSGGYSASTKFTRVERRKEEIRVNVNGVKPGTHYNNRFYNPIEFSHEDINPKGLINHLNKSVEMIREASQL